MILLPVYVLGMLTAVALIQEVATLHRVVCASLVNCMHMCTLIQGLCSKLAVKSAPTSVYSIIPSLGEGYFYIAYSSVF